MRDWTVHRRRLGCCAALLAATTFAAAAAPPAPGALAPASLREFNWVSDPRLAPDGRRVAFVQTRVDAARDDYATSIWIADGAAPPRPVTFEPADALAPRWSPDGRRLAFLSKRSGKAQIHVLEAGGGEAWQLTDDAEGAGSFAWSPDGKRIAFVSRAAAAREPQAAESPPGQSKPPFVTERLTTRADGRPGWLPARRSHLWVVATDRGPNAAATRITGGAFDDGAPAWSRDGSTLYFSAVRKPDADWAGNDTEIYAVPADGSREPKALTDRRGPDDGPVVSPDGRFIAYTGYDDERRQSYTESHLYVLDIATLERHELARGLDRSVGDGVIADMSAPRDEGLRLVWRADSKAVYFVSADRGAVQLYEATLDGRYRALTALAAGDLRAFDVAADGRVLVTHSTPTEPVELYAFRPAEAAHRGAWQALTSFNAALAAQARFVPYEEVWFEGAAPSVTILPGHAAGPRQWIQGWLLRPPGFDAAKRYPLVLYIHGGPHTMYGTAFFHEMQVLAHAGYLVLLTNPRGSTGYGEQFANVIQYRYPGDDYHDLMAAVDFALARGAVDPKRLYVAGGSGGGLLSAWTVGHTDRFAAAVVERAVTNWYSFVGAADMNNFFATHWFRAGPWQDATDYLARSPMSYVGNVTTPVLVIHNLDDYRVPLDQGLQFYTALREQKKPARLAVFPDSSHGMSRDGRPNQRIARLELILDWFGSGGR
jgi:acylaminoacyl-peptidase